MERFAVFDDLLLVDLFGDGVDDVRCLERRNRVVSLKEYADAVERVVVGEKIVVGGHDQSVLALGLISSPR